MSNHLQVVLAKSLAPEDIVSGEQFAHRHVIDLRCTAPDTARPVEEAVIRRLSNRFIGYVQMPMAMDRVGPCQEVHLCEYIRETGGNILVLCDDIAPVASLLKLFAIPHGSSVFYVVETGKGDRVHTLPADNPARERDYAATG